MNGIVERYSPELIGNIEIEHMHRYALAREFVHGKRVLDLASGEGYGSHFLSQVAGQVIGVDIDEPSILNAQQKYIEPNLEYRVGTCSNVPIPTASMDVVVSFETIEHHDEHEEMMVEIKRVLRPNGLLILSCPNKHHSDLIGMMNPFHVKELYREELERLLASYFKNRSLFGSKVVSGCLMTPLARQESTFLTFHKQQSTLMKERGIHREEHYIAFCSDGDLPHVPHSLYEGTASNDLHDKDVHIRNLTALLEHKEVHIRNLTLTVDKIKSSILWKLIYPIRRFSSWLQ